MMKEETEYLIDLKKLDRFETIAFQKAYEKVKKDVRVFEAELRQRIAQEVYQEEYKKIKKRLEKDISVRLEKQYKEKYKERMIELEHLIRINKQEKQRLEKQWEYLSKVQPKKDSYHRYKYQIADAIEYQKENDVTVRYLHQKFCPQIALSTFHSYMKRCLRNNPDIFS